MSRFDLIFLVLDPKDEAYDRKLATHLVSLYHTDRQDVAKGQKTVNIFQNKSNSGSLRLRKDRSIRKILFFRVSLTGQFEASGRLTVILM